MNYSWTGAKTTQTINFSKTQPAYNDSSNNAENIISNKEFIIVAAFYLH